MNLQRVDPSLRNRWMETIHNDILTPLYFANVEEFAYSNENPFVPNEEKLNLLRLKDFAAFNYEKGELRDFMLHIFSDFIGLFHLDIKKLQRFIFAVSENYQNNPFHNYFHATSVTQMVFAIGEKAEKYERFLTPLDRLSLLLSSYGHDLNHPGVTNALMVNSRHPLAITYNDASVLENHHAATLINFLELSGCDIFSDFSLQDKNYLRRIIIPTILGTDMAKHKTVMSDYTNIFTIGYDKNNQDHRQSVMSMVLHSADVGNPCYKFELATVWSLRIIQEFNQQVMQEETRGLPVSEFLRIGNDIRKIKQNQMGFIDGFIYPLWKLLALHMQEAQEYVEAIELNRKLWEELENLDS